MSARHLAIASTILLMSSALAASQDAKPTDPQIAHIAYTAGQIDIEAAQLALKKSKNKAVRSFAEDMVRDHTAVNDALEKQLIPSASNAELKSLLQTGLKIFKGHQQHAEQVAAAK